MNKVILSGRMTRDAEVNTYGKGKDKSKVARFSIAVRDGKDAKGEPQAQFIRCVAFGALAELIDKFTEKGQIITVAGRLKNGSYEDEKEKITRYTTDVVIEDLDLFGSASHDEDDEDEEEEEKSSKKSYKRHR